MSNSSPTFYSPHVPRILDSSLYSEWKLVNRSHECSGSPGDLFSVRISCPPLRRKAVVFSFDDHWTYDPHIRVVLKWRPRFRLYELSTIIPRLEDNVDREIVVGIHLSSYLRGKSDGFVVGKIFYKAKHRSASPSPLYDRIKRCRKSRQRPGKNVRMRWKDPHRLVRP
jgi:hypothetical protein